MLRYREPFPWNFLDPNSENCYSSTATLLREVLTAWLKKYGEQRGYLYAIYKPQPDAFVCAIDGHAIAYAGRARPDLVPTERDRQILKYKLSPFETLEFHYHAFNRKIYTMKVPAQELLEFI